MLLTQVSKYNNHLKKKITLANIGSYHMKTLGACWSVSLCQGSDTYYNVPHPWYSTWVYFSWYLASHFQRGVGG